MTADELLTMPDDGYRYELVKGELIRMAPTGDEHGDVTMELAVYRSLTDIVTLTVKDKLDGADVVSGFQINVAEIFTD